MLPNPRGHGEAVGLSPVPQPSSGRDQLDLWSMLLLIKDRKKGKPWGQWDSPPTLHAPDPAQESQPGTAGSEDLLLTLDLVVRSAVHPVPVPLAPCLGQADPVGKSACRPVEKLLQEDRRQRRGVRAPVSLGIFTHPRPQPLHPQTQGWDSILTLTLTCSAGPLKMKGSCLIFCLTR